MTPLVGIIMGSDSDLPVMQAAADILKEFGIPEMYIGMFTMWATAVAQNTMDVEDDTLKIFLGRNPTTLQQFIDSVYAVK